MLSAMSKGGRLRDERARRRAAAQAGGPEVTTFEMTDGRSSYSMRLNPAFYKPGSEQLLLGVGEPPADLAGVDDVRFLPVTCWQCTYEFTSPIWAAKAVDVVHITGGGAPEITCPRCRTHMGMVGSWTIERHLAAGIVNVTQREREELLDALQKAEGDLSRAIAALERTDNPQLRKVAAYMKVNPTFATALVTLLVANPLLWLIPSPFKSSSPTARQIEEIITTVEQRLHAEKTTPPQSAPIATPTGVPTEEEPYGR